MRAVISCNKEFAMVYNKEWEAVFAGRLWAIEREFSKSLVDILLEKWEYQSPYYNDKAQLEIKF